MNTSGLIDTAKIKMTSKEMRKMGRAIRGQSGIFHHLVECFLFFNLSLSARLQAVFNLHLK